LRLVGMNKNRSIKNLRHRCKMDGSYNSKKGYAPRGGTPWLLLKGDGKNAGRGKQGTVIRGGPKKYSGSRFFEPIVLSTRKKEI